MEYLPSYKDELYHHGILGQKWGVRRYQNSDGSYTDAGKKRYLNNDTTTWFGRLKQNRAERKELRGRIANAQKRNLHTIGRTDSKEIAKIKDEYKKAMNSDKLRMLRAEAKVADKESIDALNDRFRAANTFYKNRERIRNGEKIDPFRRALDNMDYYNSRDNYYKKAGKYDNAYDAYKHEYEKVSKPYIDRCKKVALRDLGFSKDSERGKNLMDRHNMWKKYFTMPDYSDIYSLD